MPVGFIDDDADKQNLKIMGLPVLAQGMNLKVIGENNIQEILIAMPSAGQVVKEIVENAVVLLYL